MSLDTAELRRDRETCSRWRENKYVIDGRGHISMGLPRFEDMHQLANACCRYIDLCEQQQAELAALRAERDESKAEAADYLNYLMRCVCAMEDNDPTVEEACEYPLVEKIGEIQQQLAAASRAGEVVPKLVEALSSLHNNYSSCLGSCGMEPGSKGCTCGYELAASQADAALLAAKEAGL